MCKDHDLQHYSLDLRDVAREICCGDVEMASRLLDHCTHDGLSSFMNQFANYCEIDRLSRVDRQLSASFKKRLNTSLSLSGEIVNGWDQEMSDMVPY